MPTYHALAMKEDGMVWAWGANGYGQLGTNNTTSYSSPVAVVGSHSFIRVRVHGRYGEAHSAGIKANGEMWTWGENLVGCLGDNSTTNRSSPVLVVGSHNFGEYSGLGQYVGMGLKANGQAWTWGSAGSGGLGDNSTTNKSSPVLVVGSHSFIRVSGGGDTNSPSNIHGLGLKADGSVWAWGDNASGQLGTGNTTDVSSPVAVVGNHSFVRIATGVQISMGLKANGEVWTWGLNDYGNLGDNSRTNRSSPVLVVGSHSFNQISASYRQCYFLKEDGSMWGCGNNANGQLGTGNTTSYSSPVAVIGSHQFTTLAMMRSAVGGLKADGSVWTWGYNGFGQLGNGNRTDANSPVAVVGSHSFTEIWNQSTVYVPGPVGFGLSVCVGETWYDVPSISMCIGEVWKNVTDVNIAISEAWKNHV